MTVLKGIALDHGGRMLSAAQGRCQASMWELSEGVFLGICGTLLSAVTCIYRRYPTPPKPDLWVILMAVRDIGCLFPRSPEGGRQGGVCAAGSFIRDEKSPCHIDSRLGVTSAATWALNQTTVPQRRGEPGGQGFFNLRVYQHSNSHLWYVRFE